MIQLKTVLKVLDNSGAKSVKCIKVLGGFRKKNSKLGDIIVTSIQHLRNKSKKTSKVKKKEIYKALIIKTKIGYKKKTGHEKKFFRNAVTLLNKQGNPIATRILGPLPQNLKRKKLQKIISISRGLV